MKKWNIWSAILCCSLALSVPVFGADGNTTDAAVEKQPGNVSFYTSIKEPNGMADKIHTITFSIREEEQNVFWENGKIYIALKPQNEKNATTITFQTPTVTGEHIEAKGEVLEDGHTLVITMGKRDTSEDVLAGVFVDVQASVSISGLDDEGTYDLWLLTGRDKENNIFLQKENILLHSGFFKNTEWEFQQYQEQIPSLQFTIGEQTVLWENTPISLKHEVFLSEEGRAMIALEDFITLVEELEKENDYIQMTSEDGTYAIRIPKYTILIKPELQQMLHPSIPMQRIEKEGMLYFPLREVCYALKIEDRIHWDEETQTIQID